ncbi:MAG: class I SAM-dependent methyltransferase [Planctomycetota bacterium]
MQHPLAEVALLERMAADGSDGFPLLLREDFAGSGALSQAWAMSDPDRQAMAVDHHAPTVRWGAAYRAHPDIHRVIGDVLETPGPRVDIVASLNFSAMVWRRRPEMLCYFRAARKRLRPGGVFILDFFGGPGAKRLGEQTRRIEADTEHDLPAFTYRWCQHAFDEATARIDCRVYFDLPGQPPSPRPAFRYDWRLWTAPELVDLAQEARFDRVELWSVGVEKAPQGAPVGPPTPRYRPRPKLPATDDFVAYCVARKAEG